MPLPAARDHWASVGRAAAHSKPSGAAAEPRAQRRNNPHAMVVLRISSSPPPENRATPVLSLSPTNTFDVWRSRNTESAFPCTHTDSSLCTCAASAGAGSADLARESPEVALLEIGAAEPWFVALVLVGFDSDQGQLVESCVPDLVLTHAEKEAIACNCMPDSNAGGMGREDSFFSFRVARHGHATNALARKASRGTFSRRLLLAHSLFRQAPDPALPRGSFQKALVLVTSTPFLTLPHKLLTTIADEVFVHGRSALVRAMADAARWPDPRAQTGSRSIMLRMLNSEIVVSLPEAFLTSFAAPQASVRLLPVGDGKEGKGSGTSAQWRATRERVLELSPVSSCDVSENETGDDIPTADLVRHRHTVSSKGEESRNRSVEKDVSAERNEWAGWNQTLTEAVEDHPGARAPSVVRCWPLAVPSSNPTSSPFHEIDIMRALFGVHDRIWALWELVALGEPLAVMAPTPSQASAAVLAIISLIHPLPFVGDWRPYFCIQDHDYERLADADSIDEALPNGAVFGLTSTHVLDTLKFNHVLSIAGPGNSGMKVSIKCRLKSRHKPTLYRSRQLSGAMNAAISAQKRRDINAMTAAAFDVRACLLDRVTRPFMRAFDRYLVPTWGDGRRVTDPEYTSDPFGKRLGLVNLDLETFPTRKDFLAAGVLGLFKAGTVSKTRAQAFYSLFVRGPVFKVWWRAALASARCECANAHRTAVLAACKRGVGKMTKRLSFGTSPSGDEASTVDERVELLLRVRTEITNVSSTDVLLSEQLNGLLQDLSCSLPPDAVRSLGEFGRAMSMSS